jgi:ribulose-phosphate 3-epimerase
VLVFWEALMMEPVVIPAILAKSREELLRCISQVNGLVKEIQLDIMDGEFVPNRTIGMDDLAAVPALQNAKYEFHWMVKEPEKWIEKMPGPHLHLVHVETIHSFDVIENAVKKSGGRLGLAINPETPLEKLLPFASKAQRILIMTVHPGFSGQKYITAMEKKISQLRRKFPSIDIEVDGGVNLDTVHGAYAAGANVLAAASAIFAADDPKAAIEELKKRALGGNPV